jgi:hypothetical protein
MNGKRAGGKNSHEYGCQQDFFHHDGPLSGSIQFVDPGGGGPSGWQKPPVPEGL